MEIDPFTSTQFNCRVSNLSKSVKIKRVKIEASNKPFDVFDNSDKFQTITNAGDYNDGIYGNYAILDFNDDGLCPNDSSAEIQPGLNYLYGTPIDLKVKVYLSDGSIFSGDMQDIGDGMNK